MSRGMRSSAALQLRADGDIVTDPTLRFPLE